MKIEDAILGMEVIARDPLDHAAPRAIGRITEVENDFPHVSIRVKFYHSKVEPKFAPDNVQPYILWLLPHAQASINEVIG